MLWEIFVNLFFPRMFALPCCVRLLQHGIRVWSYGECSECSGCSQALSEIEKHSRVQLCLRGESNPPTVCPNGPFQVTAQAILQLGRDQCQQNVLRSAKYQLAFAICKNIKFYVVFHVLRNNNYRDVIYYIQHRCKAQNSWLSNMPTLIIIIND